MEIKDLDDKIKKLRDNIEYCTKQLRACEWDDAFSSKPIHLLDRARYLQEDIDKSWVELRALQQKKKLLEDG